MSDALALRVAQRLIAREGTAPAWDLTLEECRTGYARVRMTLRPDMLNGHGVAHGGMIFALADSAFAYACNSRNIATVAAQASIVFLDQARAGENLIAEAREEVTVGRSGVYSIAVTTSDGRAIAWCQELSRTIGGAIVEVEED